MFLLAVTVTALAVLFLLTMLAFTAEGRAAHPVRLVTALAVVLSLGRVLLLE
jgi:hypothetical protein